MFIHLKWVCWIEFAWLCYNKMFICYVSLWRPDLWRVSRCFLYFEWKWVKVWSVRNFQLEWTWHIVTIKGYRIFFFFFFSPLLLCHFVSHLFPPTTPLSGVFVSEGAVWLQSTAAFFLCFVSSEDVCHTLCNILTT